jgi:hypothetical protein
MDIVRKLQQVGIIWNDDALTASLKQVAASRMPPVEPLRMDGIEPLHGLFKIRQPGSNKRMVMLSINTSANTWMPSRSDISPTVLTRCRKEESSEREF